MHIETLQPEDLPFVSEWWNRYDSVLPEAMLPEEGVSVWDNDDLIAAGWLYIVKAKSRKFGWAAWTTLNPEFPKRWMLAAYVMACGLRDLAAQRSCVGVMATTNSRLLQEAYELAGFAVGDTDIKQFVFKI